MLHNKRFKNQQHYLEDKIVKSNLKQPYTYVSEGIEVVVGQLKLLERDKLPHPMRSCGGGVGVDVEPPGHRRLCFPCDGPKPQHKNPTF